MKIGDEVMKRLIKKLYPLVNVFDATSGEYIKRYKHSFKRVWALKSREIRGKERQRWIEIERLNSFNHNF